MWTIYDELDNSVVTLTPQEEKIRMEQFNQSKIRVKSVVYGERGNVEKVIIDGEVPKFKRSESKET